MDVFGLGILDEISPDIIVITNSIQLKNGDSVTGRVIKWLQPRTVKYKETDTKPENTVEYAPAYIQVYEFTSIDAYDKDVNRPEFTGVQLIEFRKDKLGPIVAFNNKIRATTNDPFAFCKQKLKITRVDVPNPNKEGSYMKYEIVSLGGDDSWQGFDISKITDTSSQMNDSSSTGSYSSGNTQQKNKSEMPDISHLEEISSIKELGIATTKLTDSNPDHKVAIIDAYQRRKASLLMGGVKTAENWEEKAKLLADKYYAKEPQRHKDFLEAASAMMTKPVKTELEDDDPEDDIPF